MMKSLLSLVAVGLVVAACSSSTDTATTNDANVINIAVGGVNGNQFSPADVTVKVGQTVRWTFMGGTHNVVSGTECAKTDGNFKSGSPVGSGTFDKLFDTAGDFPYYCE